MDGKRLGFGDYKRNTAMRLTRHERFMGEMKKVV